RVDRLWPDARVEPRHRFGVVVEDVGARIDDRAHRLQVALEVWSQDFDRRPRAAVADRPDRAREDARPAVPQVVAVDRGDHRVLQPELGDRLRNAQWFAEVELGGPAGRHCTEPAGSRAHIAQDHERGRSAVPAVEDVRAPRLFTYSVEPARADHLLQVFEIFTLTDAHSDPRWNRRGGQGLRVA